ncbi:MAG: T9SS type A sorting domain-containing protein [Flavobacteriales bacterium]|nr:T9SS type A sorting domain-containing protein [Flavobacteriales bacterium]
MRRTLLRTASMVLGAMAFSLLLNAQTMYYGVNSPDGSGGELKLVDITDGTESNAVSVTLNGVQVDGCTGLAFDPVSGLVHVVVKVDSVFTLGAIDLSTGVVTPLSTLSDRIASIAFDDSGTLYGITGDGGNTPETLYTIDAGTGVSTLFVQPGTGDDGEALAYNSTNGLLYRYGGGGLFQSIDPTNGTVTDMFISGAMVENFAHALVYNGSSFFMSAGTDLLQVSVNGTAVLIASHGTSEGYKGLVDASIVGVQEPSAWHASVFPNPARDRLEITVEEGGIDRILIHTASGALIRDLRLNGANRQVVDVSELADGLYTMELQNGTTRRNLSFSVVR